MTAGNDGVIIDQDAVAAAAGRLPIDRGQTAASSAAALPSGQLFGNSPAGRSLAEVWTLAADHHRTVTAQLREDLLTLRDALTVVLGNTAEAEADAAAQYARATEQYATVAEQRSSELMTSTDEFITANESEVAEELAAERTESTMQADLTQPAQGGPAGPPDAGAPAGGEPGGPSSDGPPGAGAARPAPPTGGNGPYG
ncbi:hypothetical protein [Georgenia faecalis]|uniref:hypothetical protein n=1 Tax=Georgenia faecalis TaxID=2483799 RepID=UPI000FD88FD4|nr:hypothetical protein [Georgenia faecalis]